MAKITLITGGTRSGKSFFAQKLATGFPEKRMFIATATPFDDEMKLRIAKHQQERGNHFSAVEAPYDLAAPLKNITENTSVILIDCLTVWLGNLMYLHDNNDDAVQAVISGFCTALDTVSIDTIIVTNEVGMGIVPDNVIARQFRDLAGMLNRVIAEKAETVYLCTCGIPIKIK